MYYQFNFVFNIATLLTLTQISKRYTLLNISKFHRSVMIIKCVGCWHPLNSVYPFLVKYQIKDASKDMSRPPWRRLSSWSSHWKAFTFFWNIWSILKSISSIVLSSWSNWYINTSLCPLGGRWTKICNIISPSMFIKNGTSTSMDHISGNSFTSNTLFCLVTYTKSMLCTRMMDTFPIWMVFFYPLIASTTGVRFCKTVHGCNSYVLQTMYVECVGSRRQYLISIFSFFYSVIFYASRRKQSSFLILLFLSHQY